MPLHPDAIPTSEQVRETLFDRFYYPYQKQIWAAGTVLAIAILGFLGWREFQRKRLDEQWARRDAALMAGRAGADSAEKAAAERVALLERLVDDFPRDPVTPWALHDLMNAQREAGQYEASLATLERLRRDHKDFLLNTEAADKASGAPSRSLAERVAALTADEQRWAQETTYTHPEPSKDVLALVETTVGSFWLAFYQDQAPEHVAQFQRLAKSGWFNGTQIYHVRQGGTPELPTPMLFEGGSAASRFEGPESRRNPADHDADEPTATIEPEDARYSIRHLYGVVSSALMDSGESAHRFMVVCAPKGLSTRYDGETTPFAAVVLDREGSKDVIERIALAKTYFTDPSTKDDPQTFTMRDHPYPPIWIRRVTLWKDEKILPGHTWDTKRAESKGSEPEPWEASLPAPPLPKEFAPAAPTPPGEGPEKK